MSRVNEHERVQLEMAAARAALSADAREMKKEFEKLTNWRQHFRRHPWLFCGGAAAMGFFAVPRRRSSPPANPPVLAESSPIASKAPRASRDLAKTFLEVAAATLAEGAITAVIKRRKDQASTDSTQQAPHADLGNADPSSDSAVPPPHDATTATDRQEAPAQETPDWELLRRYARRKLANYPKPTMVVALAAGIALGWTIKRK